MTVSRTRVTIQQSSSVQNDEFVRECGLQSTCAVVGPPRLGGLEGHGSLKVGGHDHEPGWLRRSGRVAGVVGVFQVQERSKGRFSLVAIGPDNAAGAEDVEVRLPEHPRCGHTVGRRDGEQVDVAFPVV